MLEELVAESLLFLHLTFLGIGWIADFFRILLGSFRDNVGAPLRQ